MDASTSIGPADPQPPANAKDKPETGHEAVDAQDANAFDMRQGLAGAEAKPFAGKQGHAEENLGDDAEQEAAASQPADDPNQADPNQRSDMISERRNPGSHGGAGSPGRKP